MKLLTNTEKEMQYPTSKSFMRGLREVPYGRVKEVRAKLAETLGLKSRVGLDNRIRGRVNHSVADCMKIEAVFAEYGIENPWGE